MRFINLVKNELKKIFARPSVYVLTGLALLFLLLTSATNTVRDYSYPYNENWRETYQMQLDSAPENERNTNPYLLSLQYRLDKNIAPTDWRENLVSELYNLLSQVEYLSDGDTIRGEFVYGAEPTKPGYPVDPSGQLTKEQMLELIDRLTRIIEENDWRDYVSMQIDILRQRNEYLQADIDNLSDDMTEAERQQIINSRKTEISINKKNIELYQYRLKYEIPLQESKENWKNNLLTAISQYNTSAENLKSGIQERLRIEKEAKNKPHDIMLQQQVRAMRLQPLSERMQWINDAMTTSYYCIEHNIMPRTIISAEENMVPLFAGGSYSPLNAKSGLQTSMLNGTSTTGNIALIMLILAGGMVSAEFSKGTIRLLLIRPHKRWKILLSKYISLLLLLLVLMLLVFVFSIVFSGIFNGFDGLFSSFVYSRGGTPVQMSFILFYLLKLLLSAAPGVVLLTLAFMLSSLTRNTAVSVGLSMFVSFIGLIASALLPASGLGIARLLPFNHLNLDQHLDMAASLRGVTPLYSLLVLGVYMALMLLIAFLSFTKRDVKN